MAKTYSADKERDLLIKAKNGDLMARQEIIREYMNMLNSIIYKKNVDPNQRTAVMMEAVRLLDYYINRWDPSRQNKPLTFLYNEVDTKLNRYIDDRKNPIRIIETYGQDVKKYTDSKKELTSTLGRNPTNYEILDHMKLNFPAKKFTLKHVNRISEGLRRSTSSSNILGSDDDSVLTEADINFLSPDEGLIMDSYRKNLNFTERFNRIQFLTEPERSIIYYLSGTNGYPKMGLEAVAAKFGIKKYKVIKYRDEGLARIGMKIANGKLELVDPNGL